jgi:hypothetical protein
MALVSNPRWRWTPLLLVACALIYVGQCAWFIQTQSFTYDEPVHIAEGLDAWRNGRFEAYNDHPPLARLFFTLGLLDPKWQIEIEPLPQGFHVPRVTPDPVALARRARVGNVMLGLLLAGLLWVAAAKVFSESAANFAVLLFIFSPQMIAHFSLATTDGAATLLIFATAIGVAWWRARASLRRTAILGVVLGLLLLAKFSTPPIFLLAVFWMFLPHLKFESYACRQPALLCIALAFVIAGGIVWAGYFFHISRLSFDRNQMVVSFPHRHELTYPVHSPFPLKLWVPAGEYLEGLRNTVRHNAKGQAASFLGQTSQTGGWKLYFPVVALLKWPTTTLLLFVGGAWCILRGRSQIPVAFWVILSFPLLYFAISIFAHFDLGDRHILPVYPFLLLFAAAFWHGAQQRRTLKILAAALLVMHVADGLRYAPDYLSYFNVWIRPSQSYRLISDSNLDWGQGLLALRAYQQIHPHEDIYLAYFGSVDPSVYGIHFRPLGEKERVSGTVIVSATNLSGQYLKDPTSYRWLLQHAPATILNHSLYVFQVPPGGQEH